MTTCLSLLATAAGSLENMEVKQSPRPVPKANELLLRTRATALNPVFWKQIVYNFWIPSFPYVAGGDLSGVVEAVGEEVKNFKVGDEVFGLGGHGFSEFSTLPADLATPKPINLTFEAASTFPLAGMTAGLQLFHSFGLPLPSKVDTSTPGEFVLIWGGSGSVGAYAVQLASLAGLQVIATCSAKNFEMVQALGAKHVIDYRQGDEHVLAEVKKIVGDNLIYAVDTISAKSASICAKALSTTKPAHISFIAGAPDAPPSNITLHDVLLGKVLADPATRAWLGEFNAKAATLFTAGKLRPNEIYPAEGPQGIWDGLKLLQAGSVSGKKIVASFPAADAGAASATA